MAKTPITKAGLEKYDKLSPMDAAVKAWITPGPNPAWHAAQQKAVQDTMPLLARALDRAAGIRPRGER
jgi:hypothetical protein